MAMDFSLPVGSEKTYVGGTTPAMVPTERREYRLTCVLA
jgi:hypothetical protein